MRKIYAALIILSVAGMIISGLLVIDHYLPWVSSSILKCGPGTSPCSELSSLPYSEIFGIPVASLGFFFYIWIFFSSMLFWESGGEFRSSFVYLLLPVAAAGILSDVYFAGLLIYLKIFCKYCVTTYFINIMIFAVALYWYFRTEKVYGKWLQAVKKFLTEADKNGALKFISGAFMFFTTMLFLFIIAFSLYMKEASTFRSTDETTEEGRLDEFFNEYVSRKPETVSFPETANTYGKKENRLEIIVVTDPFCSACYSFHSTALPVLEKYSDDIYIRYYFYPLDSACNSDVKNTVYKNSCEAVRTITAFSNVIDFSTVFDTYYENFTEIEKAFKRDEIDYRYIWQLSGLKDRVPFQKFNSEVANVTDDRLREMADAAIRNRVEATPTLFINGRRLEGTPPPALFERIIEFELSQVK